MHTFTYFYHFSWVKVGVHPNFSHPMAQGATTEAAECIGRAHQHRVPDLLGRADRVADRVAAGALSDLLATGFDDLNQRGERGAWHRGCNEDGKRWGNQN